MTATMNRNSSGQNISTGVITLDLFHVIERNVWQRALVVIALLSMALVMYWLSGSETDNITVSGTSLFQKWVSRDSGIETIGTDRSADDTAWKPLDTDSSSTVRIEPIGTGFFDEYRMERDRSRAMQIEQLKEFLQFESLSTMDTQARNELMRLLQRTEQEIQAEGLLRARGLMEALVVVADSGAIVVVTDSLTQSEAGSIGNVVANVTGIPLDRITISDGVRIP